MKKRITLTIPGKPIAKSRPKFYRRGKHVGTYSSQTTEEGRFMLECKSQLKGHNLFEGPLRLCTLFCMPIPKSYSKKKRAQIECGDFQHTKKPDLDNLLKFVKDCLNGLVWVDDSQIVKVEAKKIYTAAYPETIIMIQEV